MYVVIVRAGAVWSGVGTLAVAPGEGELVHGSSPGIRPWRAMVLLDNDRQVHPLVHNTVDVVGPRCVKWSYLSAIAIDLQVADSRCAWLVRWFSYARMWRTDTSSTSSSFEPLEIVTKG